MSLKNIIIINFITVTPAIINYLCNTDSILCSTTRYVSHIEALHHIITSVIIISIIVIHDTASISDDIKY